MYITQTAGTTVENLGRRGGHGVYKKGLRRKTRVRTLRPPEVKRASLWSRHQCHALISSTLPQNNLDYLLNDRNQL